ncbi:MAG: hypothetical protein EZS28_051568, partial [Streblomastix strix]
EGLRLMHEKGLIHRDIKGENILLHNPPGTEQVIAKIADFGLVKVKKQAELSTLITTCGTLKCMAPELLYDSDDEDYEQKIKADEKIYCQRDACLTTFNPKQCFMGLNNKTSLF